MEYRNVNYLDIMCYFAKWIEIGRLNSKPVAEINKRLKVCFCRYGILKEVVSDNVLFNSFEFKTFAKKWDFECTFEAQDIPKIMY